MSMRFAKIKTAIFGALLSIGSAVSMRGVYAPIPEVEQGKALTVYVTSGIGYDSNIFGGSRNEVSSVVYQFNPVLSFNASVDQRTFVSAAYRFSYDYMPDRPGKKSLDSHEVTGRVAHTFSPLMELDVSDTYQVSKNPESLLPGLATTLNTDQSYRRNQFDFRYAMGFTKRTGLTFKMRHTRFDYQDVNLSSSLDRSELLAGVAASHTLLPKLQAIAEYRHLIIDYDTGGSFKNKRSDFILVGLDRAFSARFSITSRVGVERRQREQEQSDSLPYGELGLKYDYGQGSYVSAGYSYSVEETSNIEIYTDTSVNRFFVNLQQALSSKIAATASMTWEPSVLHGRRGVMADQNETNTQTGCALIYKPWKRWSFSATLDRDRVQSDDEFRRLRRTRGSLVAKYVF
ncbi:MAG: hypothetical protein QM790_01300 [Nibricoccus sp.]